MQIAALFFLVLHAAVLLFVCFALIFWRRIFDEDEARPVAPQGAVPPTEAGSLPPLDADEAQARARWSGTLFKR